MLSETVVSQLSELNAALDAITKEPKPLCVDCGYFDEAETACKCMKDIIFGKFIPCRICRGGGTELESSVFACVEDVTLHVLTPHARAVAIVKPGHPASFATETIGLCMQQGYWFKAKP